MAEPTTLPDRKTPLFNPETDTWEEYSKRHWAVESAAFAQFSKQPIFMYDMKNPNNFIEVKTGKKVTKDEMLAVMEGEGKEEAQTENLTTHVENRRVENKPNKGDNKKGKREKKGKEEELNAVVKKRKFTPYLI